MGAPSFRALVDRHAAAGPVWQVWCVPAVDLGPEPQMLPEELGRLAAVRHRGCGCGCVVDCVRCARPLHPAVCLLSRLPVHLMGVPDGCPDDHFDARVGVQAGFPVGSPDPKGPWAGPDGHPKGLTPHVPAEHPRGRHHLDGVRGVGVGPNDLRGRDHYLKTGCFVRAAGRRRGSLESFRGVWYDGQTLGCYEWCSASGVNPRTDDRALQEYAF